MMSSGSACRLLGDEGRAAPPAWRPRSRRAPPSPGGAASARASNSRTRSSASSSISTSLSRIRRKTPCASTSQPGNRWSRNRLTRLSSETNRRSAACGRCAAAGSSQNRATWAGHRHQGVEQPAVRQPPQLQHQREGQVRDEREGVRRVDGQRRQHREELGEERLLQRVALGVGDLVGGDQAQALVGQFGAELAPAGLLVGHQVGGLGVDPRRAARPGVRPSWLTHAHALAHLAPSGRRRGPCRIRRGCWR